MSPATIVEIPRGRMFACWGRTPNSENGTSLCILMANPTVAIINPRIIALIILLLPNRKRSRNAEAKQNRLRWRVNPAAQPSIHKDARAASVSSIMLATIRAAIMTDIAARCWREIACINPDVPPALVDDDSDTHTPKKNSPRHGHGRERFSKNDFSYLTYRQADSILARIGEVRTQAMKFSENRNGAALFLLFWNFMICSEPRNCDRNHYLSQLSTLWIGMKNRRLALVMKGSTIGEIQQFTNDSSL